ncbi:transposase [Streptomyces sp. NPDC006539]|uniref:transposase n=1 Tax=Streptomyces sp. NPDC006539 TaxID=3155352 RepID=UPI0033AEB8CD
MGGDLSQRLVPDDLWAMVEPVLPSFRSRPQGGGTAPIDQRAVFTAVVYVLTSGCAWRYLPPTFGVSPATVHRRFSAERNIAPRIARPSVESSEHLGRHRWKIERSISWLFRYRRLTVRYERKGGHFLAFLGLAAVMTCYTKLAKIAT